MTIILFVILFLYLRLELQLLVLLTLIIAYFLKDKNQIVTAYNCHFKIPQFSPSPWMANGVLETVLAGLLPNKHLKYLNFQKEMVGEGGISIDWVTLKNQSTHDISTVTNIVLILPGIIGELADWYVSNAAYECLTKLPNTIVCVYNYRFFEGKYNWTPTEYQNLNLTDTHHFKSLEGRVDLIADLHYTVQHIKKKLPNCPIQAIGHSFGANQICYYVARFPNEIKKVISVAGLYDFHIGKRSISKYMDFLMSKMLSLKLKKMYNTIYEIDQNFTHKLFGYRSVDDYYTHISSSRLMSQITTPVLFIHALDDPVTSVECLPKKVFVNPHLSVLLTKNGGHIGFVQGIAQLSIWYMPIIGEYFQQS